MCLEHGLHLIGKYDRIVSCGQTCTKGYSQQANSTQRLGSMSLRQPGDWAFPEIESTTMLCSQQQRTYSGQAMECSYWTCQLHLYSLSKPAQMLFPSLQDWRLQSQCQSTKQRQSNLLMPALPVVPSAKASVQECGSKSRGKSSCSSSSMQLEPSLQ